MTGRRQPGPGQYTIGWVSALPIELAAAQEMIDEKHDVPSQTPGDTNRYTLGRIGVHNVVMACLPKSQMGTSSAAVVAAQMKSTFPTVQFILMVGIGGGVPSADLDIRLGDVVVSQSNKLRGGVLQYDFGKATKDGFQRTGFLNNPPPLLLKAIAHLEANHHREQFGFLQYVSQLNKLQDFKREAAGPDILFKANYEHVGGETCEQCSPANLVERKSRGKEIMIHYGTIASGNQVVKNALERDRISCELGGVLCFEMEAAGLMNDFPCLVIRGICDYSDSHKNKRWQGYAAGTAAAYAKELLYVIPPVEDAQSITINDGWTDEDKCCLRDLLLSNPDDDRRRIEDTKGGLLDDSFRWVLDNAEYRNWHNNPQSQLLWIKGDAGKGKTMLMIGIIKELLQHVQLESSQSLAYFLCQATDSQLNNATVVLRGLIHMLISQQPHLILHLRRRYDLEGRKLFEGENAFYSLSSIFENLIQDSNQTTAYLLVDALDECEGDLSDLLKLIMKTTMLSGQVKWIVSSRNRDDIEQILDTGHEGNKLSLELNEHHISRAVSTYIDHAVSQLKLLEHNICLQEQVHNQLSQKSEGTFLWVALVVQDLRKCWRPGAIIEKLEKTPKGLTPLYDRMMQQITQLEDQDREICVQMLSVITLAFRPLHLQEICQLTGKHGLKYSLNDLEKAVGMCGSFLTARGQYLYFIHQSAKDHLNGQALTAIFPMGRSAIHYKLFCQSLQVLSTNLRRNIYNIRNAGVSISDIAALRPNPDPLTAVRYSCTFWLDHFLKVDPSFIDKSETSENGVIAEFFSKHLLHWLESLSLIGELPHAILTLRKLVYQLQAQNNFSSMSGTTVSKRGFWSKLLGRAPRVGENQRHSVLKEAERFANGYGSIIQEAPLQTYGAALIFCPQKSESKRRYWVERLDFIKHAFGIQEWWDPWMQTLEDHDHWVNAVAFSPNGQMLASASEDRTVRLWDTATGTVKRTLRGHDKPVKAVAFSPNGQTLASASSDHTVQLWDTATGTMKLILVGHDDWVNAVAFSPNGQTLASASSDHAVRLWDTATGMVKRTLWGHNHSVNAVAFSPNGQTLASASKDCTVRLWDTVTGAVKRTLWGHDHFVKAVDFSPNGQTLASASEDRTVRLWDIATGTMKQILVGHDDWVNAVAFSPNGQTLASASSDRTVRLWDTAMGIVKQTLRVHDDFVNAVAFSPNGETLASASSDRTARLWDTAMGTVKLRGHDDFVKVVVFSPNGQTLASASSDRTVRLWDTATGTVKRTLRGHDDWVNAVAFSPNGQTLASASKDCTVRLWDTVRGTVKRTLRGHDDWVNAVAFSLNGQMLASASKDCTVRLWDTVRGTMKRILWVHNHWVNAVAFSPNGQTLASASSDYTVLLWDTATCTVKWTLRGHDKPVKAVAFSPNGQTLASASNDDTVRLWDTATGTVIGRHYGATATLSFSADGHHLNTDWGSLSLRSHSCKPFNNKDTGSGILVHKNWITCDGRNLIWLPPEYRATCVAVSDYNVALGQKSGRVTFLKLNQLQFV